MRVPWLLAVVAVAASLSALAADTARAADQPIAAPRPAERNTALPHETACPVPLSENAPGRDWSQAEEWAWNDRLCLGQEADFADRTGLDQADCLTEAEGEPRALSESFLRTILFYEPFRSAWGQHGLRVICAAFPERIDLSYGAFSHEIMIRDSYFADSLNAENLVVDDVFVLNRSRIAGAFTAYGLRVNGDLVLYDSRFENHHAGDQGPSAEDPPADQPAANDQEDGVAAGADDDPQARCPVAGIDGDDGDAIILENADIAGDLKADGACVLGRLNARHLVVGGTVSLDNGDFSNVDLSDAAIEVNLSAADARVADRVDAQRLDIGAQLLLDSAEFHGISLFGARIAGSIRAHNINIHRLFNGRSIEVLGDVALDGISINGIFHLSLASIGGDLGLSGSRLNADLDAQRISVAGDVYLGPDACFGRRIDLQRATVGGDVVLAGGNFHRNVILSGGQIDGELRLHDDVRHEYARWARKDDSQEPERQYVCPPHAASLPIDAEPVELANGEEPPGDDPQEIEAKDSETLQAGTGETAAPQDCERSRAELVLTDLAIGTLVDHPRAWCGLDDRLHMIGFRYDRLGRVADEDKLTSDQWVDELIAWLSLQRGNDASHFHQPYEHLADTLRAQNFQREADAIMVAANDALRGAESTPFRTQFVLWVSGVTMNYGYGFWRVIVVAVALVVAGVFFIRSDTIIDDDSNALNTLFKQVWYSIDKLMPITLSQQHEGINLGDSARSYFLFHRAIGLVLWGVVLVVLSGEFTGILR